MGGLLLDLIVRYALGIVAGLLIVVLVCMVW